MWSLTALKKLRSSIASLGSTLLMLADCRSISMYYVKFSSFQETCLILFAANTSQVLKAEFLWVFQSFRYISQCCLLAPFLYLTQKQSLAYSPPKRFIFRVLRVRLDLQDQRVLAQAMRGLKRQNSFSFLKSEMQNEQEHFKEQLRTKVLVLEFSMLWIYKPDLLGIPTYILAPFLLKSSQSLDVFS